MALNVFIHIFQNMDFEFDNTYSRHGNAHNLNDDDQHNLNHENINPFTLQEHDGKYSSSFGFYENIKNIYNYDTVSSIKNWKKLSIKLNNLYDQRRFLLRLKKTHFYQTI